MYVEPSFKDFYPYYKHLNSLKTTGLNFEIDASTFLKNLSS